MVTLPLSTSNRWYRCSGSVTAAKTNDALNLPQRSFQAALLSYFGQPTNPPAEADDEMNKNATKAVEFISESSFLLNVKTYGVFEQSYVHNDIAGPVHGWWLSELPSGLTGLFVVVYSYGHSPVKAMENVQLVLSARMVVESLGLPPTTYVKMLVVQPRCYHHDKISSWSRCYSELKPFVQDIDTIAANIAKKTDLVKTTGEHCKNCPMQLNCKAAVDSVFRTLDIVNVGFPNNLVKVELNDGDITREYDALEEAQRIIKDRINVIKSHVEHRIASGQPVNGFTMRPVKGHRTWAISDNEVAGLSPTINLFAGVCSPAEAERRGLPKEAVAKNTTRKTITKLDRLSKDEILEKLK